MSACHSLVIQALTSTISLSVGTEVHIPRCINMYQIIWVVTKVTRMLYNQLVNHKIIWVLKIDHDHFVQFCLMFFFPDDLRKQNVWEVKLFLEEPIRLSPDC